LVGLALFGCSSNGPGDRYVAIMAPLNGATTSFQRAVATVDDRTSAASVEKTAAPFSSAIGTADAKLTAAHWPGRTDHDVKDLVAANRALVAALSVPTRQKDFSPSGWMSQVHAAESGTLNASNAVRQDLGLSGGD
jgi:hypothetical protein